MQTSKLFGSAWFCAVLMALGTTQAQTTATWIGAASGGEWNAGANWDAGSPPLDATTNAFIGTGTNVNYNLPMAAASFGTLTLNGILNVNTNGFNASAIALVRPGGGNKLFANPGSVVNVSGNLGVSSNAVAIVTNGGFVTVQGTLQLGTLNTAGSSGFVTNYGGTINATNTIVNNNGASASSLFVINGGTNNLGNVTINRSGPSSQPTLGTEGLMIYGGLVNMTSLNVGGSAGTVANSFLSMLVAGGIVTNTGSTTVHLINTAARPGRLLQTGGLFVNPDPNVVTLNPQGAAGVVTIYSVTGGTNIVGGFQFGDLAGANIGTANFTNAAIIYIGSQGVNWSGVVTLNAALNNGGLFGATADWTGSAPMKLTGGTFTFNTANFDGTAHNITLNGVLSGTGTLNKTGGGTLTLNGTNTYSGNTFINNGTLALGASGFLASPLIVIGSGQTLDVSALVGAYSPGVGQTLSGFGSVNGLVTATNGTINPGSNALTGTLTFASGLAEQGGVVNHFDLASDPLSANNDFINVTGDLTVSGANTIQPSGSLVNGGAYKLIQYSGNFNGSLGNFVLSGATGSLSNNATTKTIYFLAQSSVRNATNVVWVGNSVNNNWDTELTTNWNNNGTLDFFVPGDSARFDNTGGADTNVNIIASVAPGLVTVDSTSNYVFTGSGSIDGATGLTKTNSGTLTILTTNNYTGVTTVGGGTVAITTIANGGTASPLGAATADPSSIVFSGGTIKYSGISAATDRGMTLVGSGVIDVTNGTALTLNGPLIGNGGLTVVDTGKLILVNSGNSYTNGTTIAGSFLQLNNAIGAGTGAITFSNGTLIYFPSGGITVANPFNFITGTTNLIVVTSGSGGVNPTSDGSWSGSGVIQISNTFNPYTVNGNLDAFTGTILLTPPNTSSGIAFRFNSGGGNSCFGSTNATFDLGKGNGILTCRNAGTMNLGALQGGISTLLQGQGAGTGTVVWSIGNNNHSTVFSGSIQNGPAANRTVSIVKVGTGTLTLNGGVGVTSPDGFTLVTNLVSTLTYTGTTTISNGVLALAAPSVLTNSPTVTLAATTAVLDASQMGYVSNQFGSDGVTLTNQLLVTNGIFEVISGQTLAGLGTIKGSLLTDSGSTLNVGLPGNTGTLTVTSSITLGGTTTLKLNRSGFPNSDQLVSSLASITYGGTLIVTNIGTALHVNDTFTLFSGTGLGAGTFSSIVLPNRYVWNTSQLGINGTINVTSVSLPGISSVDFSTLHSGSITINATNGLANASAIVLTTTNLAFPLSSWIPVTTNNFDGSGNLMVSIPVNPSAPQSFYILQSQ